MSHLACRSSFRPALLASPALALAILAGCSMERADTSPLVPASVTGKYIAVLCDADMTGTAFADNLLGPRSAGLSDSLTVVGLPIADPTDPNANNWNTQVSQVAVSNSVMGPPVSLAVSADGTRGYVVETRGPAPANATTVADLPIGRKLTAVDLSNPALPVVIGMVDIGTEPTGVDVHPNGGLVACVTKNPGAQLVIVPVSSGEPLGQPMSFALPGIADMNARPSSVKWHPSGRYLAITLPETNQVLMLEFAMDKGDGLPGVAPWGSPVTVGKFPFSGQFTPSGKHFITTDVQWGPDVEGFLTGAPEGQLSVIRLSDVATSIVEGGEERDSAGMVVSESSSRLDLEAVQHLVVSTATVGISPESLAISPDGKYVVTGNIKRSHLPDGDSRQTRGGSLTLLTLNKRGELAVQGEYDLNAMPEGISFDASGNHVVVSQFRSFDPNSVGGELAFFRLLRGSSPSLKAADFFVGVGTGPHGVLIVR